MNVVKLYDLEVYLIARKLSKEIWEWYVIMDNEIKFTVGQQIVRSADSISANIAEGFGRYHYLDSVRFYYNARGSLLETKHWIDILFERKIIPREKFIENTHLIESLNLKLNNFISYIKKRADK